jgi:hypothetical protein
MTWPALVVGCEAMRRGAAAIPLGAVLTLQHAQLPLQQASHGGVGMELALLDRHAKATWLLDA